MAHREPLFRRKVEKRGRAADVRARTPAGALDVFSPRRLMSGVSRG